MNIREFEQIRDKAKLIAAIADTAIIDYMLLRAGADAGSLVEIAGLAIKRNTQDLASLVYGLQLGKE